MRRSCLVLFLFVLVGSLDAEEKARLLIHRIGPSVSSLYVARADGTDERPLIGSSTLDYNAAYSFDGQWIAFTSEHSASADLYRVGADGSGLERLTSSDAFDDQAAWSPDGRTLAFVSSREAGGTERLDGRHCNEGDPQVNCDGRRRFSTEFVAPMARASDSVLIQSNDIDRTCHAEVGTPATDQPLCGRPNGRDLRRVTEGDRFAGSPQWSPDGRRLVFYEMNVVDTHKARSGRQAEIESQIVSIDDRNPGATGTQFRQRFETSRNSCLPGALDSWRKAEPSRASV